MEVKVAQQYADRSALRCSFLARIDLPIFQHACLQPAPDQTDQARVTNSMCDETEDPIVMKLPKKFFRSASNTHPILPPAMTSLWVAKAW